ncbi:FAD-dependent oxidoreductase [Fulvivirgaceae bacterium BMA12]|uniref:Glycerol-3-phosphate dehydrogenase n=1 Tax=Agaribacillus aureus TaxID=3051825 RepID=A0ABT8LG01_9BACT|nr:FAD-dependent oxidoreductase [Fulvivirgaceae bacterium BMA12]
MDRFSSFERPKVIDRLKSSYYDLLVIGGGITGAGIALDAASRGLKTALVEKDDFASGTSSRSTKLIHGGLRYLKQFEIALVREVGSERAIVHSLAPHLVVSEKMLLPIIEDGTFGKLLTSFGLMVYDVLAGVEKEDQRKMLSKEETLAIEPLLPHDILKGAGLYAEYRTDDARLTIEVLKTAAEFDADAINYVEASDFIYEDDQVTGIKAKDILSGDVFDVQSKYVVSAAGPWVDDLRSINHSKKGKRLHLTKGVHIVLPYEKLPIKYALYFDVPDGRMIFAIPRGRVTYVGTTDTNYFGDKDHIVTNTEDAEYLINAVNNMYPEINLEVDDVISSWAGVRPLIHEEGKSASELSRKDEIFESSTGLLSIAGGKLTGYRKMAQRIVDLVAEKFEDDFGKSFKKCFTHKIVLSGGVFKDARDVSKYTNKVFEQIKAFGFDQIDASYLVSNYGRQTDTILARFMELKDNDYVFRLAKAELWFTLKFEMVHNPQDFFIRRTGRLYFKIERLRDLVDPVIDEFAGYFDWDDDRKQRERNKINTAIFEASNFKPANS